MPVDDDPEGLRQLSVRLYGVEFAGLDPRSDCGAVFGPDIVPCEESVFALQGDGADAMHGEYDDHIFAWPGPPAGGHPGQGWSSRCTAEPVIDQNVIPESATCDILTGTFS